MFGNIALCLLSAAALIQAAPEAKSIRRYPLYAAPLYNPALPVLAAQPPAHFYAAPAYPAFVPPAPVAPVPVAAVPPPPPPPAYTPVAEVACSPVCVGNAACVQGVCACPTGVVYSPVVGCAPPPPPPPPAPVAVPVVAGRVIPQALPGAPCEPGVECTGGSVCSLGICLCPPDLVQEGSVCVARTVYGAVLPPPPPPPPAPVAYPASIAVAAAAPVAVPAPVPVALGAACVPAAAPCIPGAVCQEGVCTCAAAYVPTATACIRRRHARNAALLVKQ